MKGASERAATSMTEELPEKFKLLSFPFDLAWEKVDAMKRTEDENSKTINDKLRELKYQEI